MAKQRVSQRYIFKIHSSRLKKAKWNLSLPLSEARKNDEIISLGDSQMLRWIDELNGIDSTEAEAQGIKDEIKRLKREPDSVANRHEIKRLYAELDAVQFKPDYMDLVIDKDKDLYRACKGFKINGIKYVRLVGTNGGVKCSTIVFVSERLANELRRRIENGRNTSVPQIPAKYESYRALTCSVSIPVSMPKGVAVVADCKTLFKENVITLNDEKDGEPVAEYVDDYDIELDESDGYGLILPQLAERWSKELQLPYTLSGCCCRNSFTKGMLFPFDFVEFAEKVAGSYIIKDVWGNDVDVRTVEMIMTDSMLKLWKAYDNIEQYLANCEENHYTFAITKVAPGKLENDRTLNYQFIQSLELTDEDIDELIGPTMQEIRDILGGDYRKALLYLIGTNATDKSIANWDDNFVKAMMIDKRVFNDPFVKKKILAMIRKRIDDAKIGVLNVHGNYSIVGGDPYALMQSLFGLPVTGLLKKGEIYNEYWRDCGAAKVSCFRAPMSCENNIRKVSVSRSEAASYWFRHIHTCTLIDAFSSLAAALNGMDKDGDLVMLTDNPVIVRRTKDTRAIFCAQRLAEKREVTEDDLVRSNIAGFGDDIGKTTNYITSMYDVREQYEVGSREYDVLTYRIQAGQLWIRNLAQ